MYLCTALSGEVTTLIMGRSPGLVVMGGDLHSRVREFESQHQILDGQFVHIKL